jgi:recombination protein RecT
MIMQVQGQNGNQQRGIQGRPEAAKDAGPLDGLKALFFKARPQIASVVPKHLGPERIMRLSLAACSKDTSLLQCTPESVLLSVLQASALGLEPNTALQQCYLMPFNNRKKIGSRWETVKEAQLVIGYRGYILLAINGELVRQVDADVVFEKDVLKRRRGTRPDLEHIPSDEADPGPMKGSYCTWELANGSWQYRYWSIERLIAHRDKFAKFDDQGLKKNQPWVDWFPQMCQKTVIRDASKFWPMSTERSQAFGAALAIDDRADLGKRPDYTLGLDDRARGALGESPLGDALGSSAEEGDTSSPPALPEKREDLIALAIETGAATQKSLPKPPAEMSDDELRGFVRENESR